MKDYQRATDKFTQTKLNSLKQKSSDTSDTHGTDSVLGSTVNNWDGTLSSNSGGGSRTFGNSGNWWGNTSSTNNGGGSGDGNWSWSTCVVAARSDGDHSWQWAVGGVASDGGVSPNSGRSRGGRRRRGEWSSLENVDLSTLREWSSVVVSSINNKNLLISRVSVWIVGVGTSPEVPVGDSVLVERKSQWSNGRTNSQVWVTLAKGSQVEGVRGGGERNLVASSIVVQSLSTSRVGKEEVVETSALVL